MKIDIIKACEESDFKTYKKSRGGLPQNIFSLAAATPEEIDITLIDETVNNRVNYNTSAELIVIMFSTPDALKGYKHAQEFTRRGKTVVLGGLHPTFMHSESLEYGDSVIIGEAEQVWYDLIKDYLTGTLKQIYKSNTPFCLDNMVPYRQDLYSLKDYDWISSVIVSRGCRGRCEFCTVNKFFHTQEYRPVSRVVEEISRIDTNFIELKADNLTTDKSYCMELFTALKDLNIKWSTSADIRFALDQELLNAAVESGLNYILLGIETSSEKALKSAGKGFVKQEETARAVNELHKRGVIVDSAALFGFDTHTPAIFEETLSFFEEIEIDVCAPVILVPFPGTELFNRLKRENRLITTDWSLYDGSHAVFQPAGMSVQELEEGVYWFHKQWNSYPLKKDRKKRYKTQLGRENANYLLSNF